MAGETGKVFRVIHVGTKLIAPPLLGALLFVSIFSPARFMIDAFEVELRVHLFDSGRTELVIPPLGRIAAKTHAPPLLLRLTLLNVDLPLLETMVSTKTREQILPDLQEAFRSIALRYMLWLLILAMAGAVVISFVSGQRLWHELLRSAAIGTAGMGLLLWISFSSFRMEAFAQPQYTGILQAAPWAVELIDQSLVKAREFSDQMGLLARNLHTLFEKIDQAAPIGHLDADRKIMVISDIHNNPVALDFVEDLVTTFGPDFILDAGDLTDYGTPLEAALVERLENLPVPYVFVSGNHDSPAIIDTVRHLENGIVLEGTPVTVEDVSIVGLPDPSSSSTSPAIAGQDRLDQLSRSLEEILENQPSQVSILAVHHPDVAKRFHGRVPIVVSGHTHRVQVTAEKNSLYLNPGTTGAAGIRGLQAADEIPYSVALLYLDFYGQRYWAKAVDVISVRKIDGGLSLERKLLPPPSGLPELQPTHRHRPS